jgi:hypothetical protein
MQFLKQKALSVYNFSQIFRKKEVLSKQESRTLLLELLDNPKMEITYSAYQQLSKSSTKT